jgi:hypothetical protein
MGYEVGATEDERLPTLLDDLAEGKITVSEVLNVLKR